MEDFEIPSRDEIARMGDDELTALHASTINNFQVLSSQETISSAEMEQMRQLTALARDIRTEQEERKAAAEAAAAEIEAMAGELGLAIDANTDSGDSGSGSDSDGSDSGGDSTSTEDAGEEPTASAGQVVDQHPDAGALSTVAAADRPLPRRSIYNLSTVRRRAAQAPQQNGPLLPEIAASVDVPGYSPGQPLDLPGVTEGIIRRANALKTAGGGVGLVSSYRLPFPRELIVTDSSAGTEGSRAVMHAANQSRLNGGNIVASGGWCAPSETVYELTNVSCPTMLWDAPEIQLARGGLRFFKTPSLDVSAMTWIHTEADDIAGNEKPCFKIPCPEPEEIRCDAVGVCLEAGILTQRHFPELIDHYRNQVMVAHEMHIRQVLFEQAKAAATPVVMPETFGALPAIFEAIALQAADITERHSLCETINIEVVLPWWSQKLMLADLARQSGRDLREVRVQELINLFATLGVRIQWARGLGTAVPEQIGGQEAATAWPSQLQFLIYVAGSLQIGRGGEISLGVIHDSSRFSTNDYTALFAEECIALINRGPDVRYVTVPICPSGQLGNLVAMDCPASSPSESPAEVSA